MDRSALQSELENLRLSKRYVEAQEMLDRALIELPDDVDLIVERGFLDMDQGHHAAAIAAFDEALRINPVGLAALWNKARSFAVLRRYPEAEKLLASALQQIPSSFELMGELGRVYMDQGRYDDAIAEFDRALGIDPTYEFALEYKARCLRLLQKYDEAEHFIADALAKSPQNVALINERGFALMDRGLYDQAVGAFEAALAIDPVNVTALKNKARSLRVCKQFDNAESVLRAAIAELPQSVDLTDELGLLYTVQRRDGEALAAFDRALEIDAKDATALQFKAQSLRQLKQYPEASAVIDDALAKNPGNVDLINQRGFLLFDLRHYEGAVSAFNEALAIDPDNLTALQFKAQSLRLVKKYAEAAAVLTAALSKNPENAGLLAQRGFLALDLRRYDEALQAFDSVLRADPKDVTALQYKARSLGQLKKYAEAESVLGVALELQPQNVDLLNERGFLDMGERSFGKAVEAFDATLAIDPANAAALQNKARTLRLMKMYDDALSVLGGALEKLPGNVDIIDESGLIEMDRYRYEDAIARFDAALQIDPNDLTALRFKADCLRLLKRFDEAQRLLTDALARQPGNSDLINERGFVLMDRGLYDEAISAFDATLEIDPLNVQALRNKARSLRVLKRRDEAQALLAAALEAMPQEVNLISERGLIDLDSGRYDDAIREFDLALRMDPADVTALQFKADALRLLKQFDKAESFLADALARLPQSVDLINERGFVLMDLGRYEDAIAAFDAALKIDAANVAALKNKARSLRVLKRLGEAQDLLVSAVATLPPSSDLADELGLLYVSQGRDSEAVAMFARALEIDPKDVTALQFRAQSLRLLKQYDEAARAIEDAVAKSPGNVDIINQRGLLELDLRHYEDALASFNEVLAIDSVNLTSLQYKARSLSKLKRYHEAEQALDVAVASQPENVDLVIERGLLYMDQRRYEGAIGMFDAALGKDSSNAQAFLQKVKSLRLSRKYRDAEEVLDAAPAALLNVRDVLMERGFVKLTLRNYGEALTFFEAAASVGAARATSEVFLDCGYALERQGRLSEAVEKYNAAKNCDPTDWRPYYYIAAVGWSRGYYALGRKKWQEAADQYDRIAEFQAEPMFFACFGDILVDILGKPERAREMLERGKRLDPANLEISIGLAKSYLKERAILESGESSRPDPESISVASLNAFSEYKKAEAAAGARADSDVLRQVAELQVAFNDLDAAERSLRIAHTSDPESEWIMGDLGVVATATGDYGAAKDWLRRAKTRSPNDLDIRTNLGEAYLKSNELAAAEAEFRSVVAAAPEQVEAWIGLGEVYTAMAEAGERELYDDAIENFSRGIKLASDRLGKVLPNDKLSAAYYSRGYARVKAAESLKFQMDEGKLLGARDDFARSYDLDGTNMRAERARNKLKRYLTPQNRIEAISPWVITALTLGLFLFVQIYFFAIQPHKSPPLLLSAASYVTLTFGTLVLMVAGFYLPRILKLSFGSIHLEKSTADQMGAPTSLGISRWSMSLTALKPGLGASAEQLLIGRDFIPPSTQVSGDTIKRGNAAAGSITPSASPKQRTMA